MAGGIPISAKFDVAIAEPFDSKLESVSTFTELANTFFPYKGMQKLVEDEGDEGMMYYLGSDLVTWKQVGSGDKAHVKTLDEFIFAYQSDEITTIYVDSNIIITGSIDLTTNAEVKNIYGVGLEFKTCVITGAIETYFHDTTMFSEVVLGDKVANITSISVCEWYFTYCSSNSVDVTVTFDANIAVTYERLKMFEDIPTSGGASIALIFAGNIVRLPWSSTAAGSLMADVRTVDELNTAFLNRNVGTINILNSLSLSGLVETEQRGRKIVRGFPISLNDGCEWNKVGGSETFIECDLIIPTSPTASVTMKGSYGWACKVVWCGWSSASSGTLGRQGGTIIIPDGYGGLNYESLIYGVRFSGMDSLGNLYDNPTKFTRLLENTSNPNTFNVSQEFELIDALISRHSRFINIIAPITITSDLDITLVTDKLVQGEPIIISTANVSFTDSSSGFGVKFYNDVNVSVGCTITALLTTELALRNLRNELDLYLVGNIKYEKGKNESLILDSVGGALVEPQNWDNTGSITIGSIAKTPTSIGTKGQTSYFDGSIYTCVETNVWVKYEVSTTW